MIRGPNGAAGNGTDFRFVFFLGGIPRLQENTIRDTVMGMGMPLWYRRAIFHKPDGTQGRGMLMEAWDSESFGFRGILGWLWEP